MNGTLKPIRGEKNGEQSYSPYAITVAFYFLSLVFSVSLASARSISKTKGKIFTTYFSSSFPRWLSCKSQALGNCTLYFCTCFFMVRAISPNVDREAKKKSFECPFSYPIYALRRGETKASLGSTKNREHFSWLCDVGTIFLYIYILALSLSLLWFPLLVHQIQRTTKK